MDGGQHTDRAEFDRELKGANAPFPSLLPQRGRSMLLITKGETKKEEVVSHDDYDNKWVIHKSLPSFLLFSTGYSVGNSANRTEPRLNPRCV